MALTDDELRVFWRNRGGQFHGPHIETGTMPEALLLPLLRELMELPANTLRVEPERIVFGGGIKAYPRKVVSQAQRLANNLKSAD